MYTSDAEMHGFFDNIGTEYPDDPSELNTWINDLEDE